MMDYWVMYSKWFFQTITHPASVVRLPSNPLFHDAGTLGHVFMAKPNVPGPALKTRCLSPQ